MSWNSRRTNLKKAQRNKRYHEINLDHIARFIGTPVFVHDGHHKRAATVEAVEIKDSGIVFVLRRGRSKIRRRPHLISVQEKKVEKKLAKPKARIVATCPHCYTNIMKTSSKCPHCFKSIVAREEPPVPVFDLSQVDFDDN